MKLQQSSAPLPISVAQARRAPLYSPLSTGLARTALSSHRSAPLVSTVSMLVADLLGLAAVWALVDAASRSFSGTSIPVSVIAASAVVWVTLRALVQLYPGAGIAAPEEFRRASEQSVVTALASVALLSTQRVPFSTLLLVAVAWAVMIPVSWLGRGIAKWSLVRMRLYGRPVIIIGAGKTGSLVARELQRNPGLGLNPVAMFDDDPAKHGLTVEGVPVLGSVRMAAEWIAPYAVKDVLLALPGAGGGRLVDLAQSLAHRYPNVSVVADLFGFGNVWVRPQALGTCLALQIPHHRFDTNKRIVKRGFDLAVGVPLFLASLPAILVCAALVKLRSPGPAFYSQSRRGANGRRIRVWKIRTMMPDAEHRLHTHLEANPAAKQEWQQQMKLRRDPRVIPGIGHFIRRSSLDELPQLWNVVRGDMSLVGPRPFPDYHLSRFDDEFQSLRTQVPPGITGFWQITDRSDGDLHVQQSADSYYIQNWSLWLDLWILLKTFHVVLLQKGAY